MGGIMILQSDIVLEYMESIHVLNNLTFHFNDE